MNPKLKRRLTVTAVLLFFLGFPLFGMLFVYFQAHKTMRDSAIQFADKDVVQILQHRDFDDLEFLGTLTLKHELSHEKFDAWMEQLGPYRSHAPFRATRSTVGEREDQVWQYIDLECLVSFERGDALLRLTAARRSLALREWRVERFSLEPKNVEQP